MTAELENIISTLKSKKEYLHEKYGVCEIAVFGSYTRNDFTENSDVDIMVDFDRSIGWNIVRLADDLEKLLGKKVDLATKGGIREPYLPYINKDLLYV
jgi:predicted nucleotidyltransferase